jgi:hypothetical protein
VIDRVGFASETGKCGARIREGVHANAEPCDAVAARNSDQAEQKNNRHAKCFKLEEHAEVENDDHSDEDLEDEKKFALRDQIGFAGFVDKLGNFAHRVMYGQIFQARVNRQAKEQTENAD